MKIILSILLCFSAFSFTLNAQQNRFVFIQTESRQPFNITVNNKVYSSTASGYVIVPKMLAGKYSMAVGFGGNAIPDQYFNIEIAQKDLGYTLKNMDQKGWALFNLQTLETTYSGTSLQDKVTAEPKSNDVATKAAANTTSRTFQPEVNVPPSANNPRQVDRVAPVQQQTDNGNSTDAAKEPKEQKNDSATLQTPLQPKPVEVAKEITTDISKNEKEIPAIPPMDQDKNKTTNPSVPVKSKITKISELKGGEAIYITYVDELFPQNDTINVLIPDNRIQVVQDDKSADKKELKFLDISVSNSKDSSQLVAKSKIYDNAAQESKVAKNPMFSRCVNSASNDDFLRLRKKMAGASDTDGMISEAKKIYKLMCFSTEQIKNLGYLFLADQARYQFFDASYPFVSDASNFHSLSIMLSDTYYINRFKAMLID